MTPSSARVVDGRKFMWDGRIYASAEEAGRATSAYAADGFETWAAEEEGSFLVYTRRLVKQAAPAPGGSSAEEGR
jgi:hypothetical protein